MLVGPFLLRVNGSFTINVCGMKPVATISAWLLGLSLSSIGNLVCMSTAVDMRAMAFGITLLTVSKNVGDGPATMSCSRPVACTAVVRSQSTAVDCR